MPNRPNPLTRPRLPVATTLDGEPRHINRTIIGNGINNLGLRRLNFVPRAAPPLSPFADAAHKPPKFNDARLERIMWVVKTQIHRKLALSTLAGQTGLSVSRVSQLFKMHTGTAPARYVKQLRMECAKEMLETTFLSVKEISGRVGLNDVSHFVRDFQTAYGLSPSRHRVEFWQEAQRSRLSF